MPLSSSRAHWGEKIKNSIPMLNFGMLRRVYWGGLRVLGEFWCKRHANLGVCLLDWVLTQITGLTIYICLNLRIQTRSHCSFITRSISLETPIYSQLFVFLLRMIINCTWFHVWSNVHGVLGLEDYHLCICGIWMVIGRRACFWFICTYLHVVFLVCQKLHSMVQCRTVI